MRKSGIFICALVLLMGCGDSNNRVAAARHKLHSVATTSLLLLDNVSGQTVWPRYAIEHLRDTRKSLDEIGKDLADDNSQQARQLTQQSEQIDQLLKDLQTGIADRDLRARSVHQLQLIEVSLRDEEPR